MFLKMKTQQGSALVIAIFIIVVMLALVLSLSRMLMSSGNTVVYEVQGSRTLFAAQSALEMALVQVFPLNAASAGCAAVSSSQTFSAQALQGCSATLTCSAFTDPTPGTSTVYRLGSSATCSAGGFITSRSLQIEVR